LVKCVEHALKRRAELCPKCLELILERYCRLNNAAERNLPLGCAHTGGKSTCAILYVSSIPARPPPLVVYEFDLRYRRTIIYIAALWARYSFRLTGTATTHRFPPVLVHVPVYRFRKLTEVIFCTNRFRPARKYIVLMCCRYAHHSQLSRAHRTLSKTPHRFTPLAPLLSKLPHRF
jgi:hypothetical protein